MDKKNMVFLEWNFNYKILNELGLSLDTHTVTLKRKWYITICKNETPIQDICGIHTSCINLKKRLPVLYKTLNELKTLYK